jgi:large conductance mechanosensitive channel
MRDFKEFLLRGNIVDLAVAVVIGVAFGAVVTSLVEDLLTPLIAALGGQPDFAQLTFTVNGSVFRYGEFLNAVVSFVMIAAAVFFFFIKPFNGLLRRSRRGAPVDETAKKCPECLSEIPLAASRCAYCTVELGRSTGEV